MAAGGIFTKILCVAGIAAALAVLLIMITAMAVICYGIRHFDEWEEKMVMAAGVGGMGAVETINLIGNVGVTVVMLVIFVGYVLQKAKNDDKRVTEAQQAAVETVTAAYTDAQAKIEEANRAIREREDILISNSMEREEILRKESEKREELIRKESEKRESILMLNMDRITESMDSITKALNKIESSFSGIDRRLEKIEERIGTADEQA